MEALGLQDQIQPRMGPDGVFTPFGGDTQEELAEDDGHAPRRRVPRRIDAMKIVCSTTREVPDRWPWKPCKEKITSNRIMSFT